jgi:hypothetical protein
MNPTRAQAALASLRTHLRELPGRATRKRTRFAVAGAVGVLAVVALATSCAGGPDPQEAQTDAKAAAIRTFQDFGAGNTGQGCASLTERAQKAYTFCGTEELWMGGYIGDEFTPDVLATQMSADGKDVLVALDMDRSANMDFRLTKSKQAWLVDEMCERSAEGIRFACLKNK